MKVDVTELRTGLSATAPYLLSHHVPSERYRCYSPAVLGRRIHVCARCAGVYPGIAAGLLAPFVAPSPMTAFALVAVLPLPALVDWTFTSLTERRGYNGVRTMTGAALGYGYGLGIVRLLSGLVGPVLAVGVVYALAAGLLLSFFHARA